MSPDLTMLAYTALLTLVLAFPPYHRARSGEGSALRRGKPRRCVTAFGATLFFWSRVAHVVMYIAGVPWLRTVAFGASLIGSFGIALEIL